MKKPIISLLLIITFLMVIDPVQAQTPYHIKSEKITVAGSSSLHDWVSEVTTVEWSGSLKLVDGQLTDVASVRVKIPVTSIKSDNGRIMDGKTYDAFNSEKYPTITYQMSEATLSGDVIKATGTLTMAGASKVISLDVKASVISAGDVQLTGSYTLNMRDYKMTPPTAVMGTIKVGEEVTINFDLTLSPGQGISKK
ncbi:MAG: YceI family protein [Cyclobacteriaceae bacterium]|jgi:polyisoprenoid-binding protein YceI|nr:YceI family protein [Cyclobacteriaceae bacterium]